MYSMRAGHLNLKTGGGWGYHINTPMQLARPRPIKKPLPVKAFSGSHDLPRPHIFPGPPPWLESAKKTEVGRRSGFPNNLSPRLPKYTELEVVGGLLEILRPALSPP